MTVYHETMYIAPRFREWSSWCSRKAGAAARTTDGDWEDWGTSAPEFVYYNVMLVEWDGARLVARRRGLEELEKRVWALGQGEARTVVLG